MRGSATLYVGDVHGCAEELAALVTLADAERVVLVGDLFTKGPDPDGVWALIQEAGFEAVLGNHDAHVLERWDLEPERRRWLEALPLFIEEEERVVVHAGIHPTEGIAGTTRAMALTMRRFPDDAGPFWYDLYEGPRTVVFGHDAKRGLIQRERKGRLLAVGLDTGCVYGGALTGWLSSGRRFLSVKARRRYCPIKGR
ncbi:MAG TPA: metallophosphoesterase family protein [Myxococcota bacterium]|nr:metallophosphoesterase family protein [Myxococcota bacterium]